MTLPPRLQFVAAMALAAVGARVTMIGDDIEPVRNDLSRRSIADLGYDPTESIRRLRGREPYQVVQVAARPGFESPRPLSKRAKRRLRGKGVK